MTKKNKNILYIVLAVVIIAAVIFAIVTILKKLKTTTQNVIADSPLGNVLGVRSAAAAAAYEWLKNCLWLQYPNAVKLNAKYNIAQYELDYMDTSEATNLSNDIINANSRLPLGLGDDSDKALAAIFQIQSQVQAVQVVFAYYNSVGKNLGAGLGWMEDSRLIQAFEHFKALPTGVKLKSTGQMLPFVSL